VVVFCRGGRLARTLPSGSREEFLRRPLPYAASLGGDGDSMNSGRLVPDARCLTVGRGVMSMQVGRELLRRCLIDDEG